MVLKGFFINGLRLPIHQRAFHKNEINQIKFIQMQRKVLKLNEIERKSIIKSILKAIINHYLNCRGTEEKYIVITQ